MTIRWYCVYTRPSRENTAAAALRDAGYAVFFPWFFGLVSHARKQTRVIRPLFPQYLFLGVGEGQGLHAAATARGVDGLVSGAVREREDGEDEHGPLELSAETIAAMQAECDDQGQVLRKAPRPPEPRRWVPRFVDGTPVVLTRGPLAGGEGVVSYDDGESPEVAVRVNMLGREIVAHVMAEDLAATRRKRAVAS